jgi:hypothetical protein
VDIFILFQQHENFDKSGKMLVLCSLQSRYLLAILPHACHRSVPGQTLQIAFWEQPSAVTPHNSRLPPPRPHFSLHSKLKLKLSNLFFVIFFPLKFFPLIVGHFIIHRNNSVWPVWWDFKLHGANSCLASREISRL